VFPTTLHSCYGHVGSAEFIGKPSSVIAWYQKRKPWLLPSSLPLAFYPLWTRLYKRKPRQSSSWTTQDGAFQMHAIARLSCKVTSINIQASWWKWARKVEQPECLRLWREWSGWHWFERKVFSRCWPVRTHGQKCFLKDMSGPTFSRPALTRWAAQYKNMSGEKTLRCWRKQRKKKPP